MGMMMVLMALGLSPIEAHVYHELYLHDRQAEYACVHEIYQAESSWNPHAVGDRNIGGSYGLPQRHAPAHGKPPLPWPVRDQVRWTMMYADERYGDICKGAEFRRARRWW